jgi:hypothetical protein
VEKGAAEGKILLVPPGQKAPDDVAGFHVVQMTTRFGFIGYRIMDRAEKDSITPLIKLYPYSERANPGAPKVIDATKDYTQSAPRGLAFWESVNDLIQNEPVEDRDRFFYGMLRELGIEKGKPFKPDERMTKILEDATLLGEEIAKVTAYEKRGMGNSYRPDASWEQAMTVDPSQRKDDYGQFDQRLDWLYEAIATSKFMKSKWVGLGSAYLVTYRDKDGDWFEGGSSYRLHVAPDPPMKQFWSVSVYDIDSRTLLRNDAQKAEISSHFDLQKNADGSVDLYFGPTAPNGKESNWVQTVPGKFWFPYFRLYGPTEAYFDKSWPLPDVEKVN